MATYRYDRRDADFVMFEHLGLGEFVKKADVYKDFGTEELRAVMDAALKLTVDALAPTNKLSDELGAKLTKEGVRVPEIYEDLWKQYREGGWVAASRSAEFGGGGLPALIGVYVTELVIGAAPSFSFFGALATAAGHLLEAFAEPELKKLLLGKLYSGEWSGTMCLTEPQAGSSVGDLSTVATPIPGTNEYSIVGNKIFISAGDHQLTENIVHLVLARVPGDPPDIKGISLFAVPKIRFDKDGKLLGDNDVKITAIEHKMGIKASPTCAMAFGDNGECRGYIIGERCQGIVYMFKMMNEARIATGLQGVAAANLAYQLALAYARDRIQGRKLTAGKDARPCAIIEHPDVRRNLMMAKAIGEGTRALLYKTGMLADMAHHHPDEEVRVRSADLLELLTPVCKAYATDQGFRATELAIQIHGGYGYVKEYGVEQLMRDTKIASLYEGTNGIQALDLLGRKMRMKGGAAFMTWMQTVNELVEKHKGHERLADLVEAVDKAKNTLGATAMGFMEQGKKDPELPLLGATPFLEMFGHVEVAHLLLEQALIADEKLRAIMAEKKVGSDGLAALVLDNEEARFYDAKVKTARFFFSQVLPHATAISKSISLADRSALDVVFPSA